jgi:hypothetical protein
MKEHLDFHETRENSVNPEDAVGLSEVELCEQEDPKAKTSEPILDSKRLENIRDFSKRFSEVQRKELAFYIQCRKRKGVNAEDLKKRISEFYDEQNEIRKDWIETQAERDVGYQSEKRKILFLHGIPAFNDFRMSAGYRHAFDNSISQVEKALIVAFLQPAISSTTMHLESETPSHERLPFRTGLILNGGKILNASEFDDGTYTKGFDARYSKYFSKQSSVQTNIAEKTESAVKRIKNNQNTRGWNELSIYRPEICALYAALEEGEVLNKMEETMLNESSVLLGIPVVYLRRNGDIIDRASNQKISISDLMKIKISIDKETKIQRLENLLRSSKAAESRIQEVNL